MFFLNLTFGKDPCYLEENNQKQQASVYMLCSLPSRLDCCIRGSSRVSSKIIHMPVDVSVNVFVLTPITIVLLGFLG